MIGFHGLHTWYYKPNFVLVVAVVAVRLHIVVQFENCKSLFHLSSMAENTAHGRATHPGFQSVSIHDFSDPSFTDLADPPVLNMTSPQYE